VPEVRPLRRVRQRLAVRRPRPSEEGPFQEISEENMTKRADADLCLDVVKSIRQPNNRGRGPTKIVRCGQPLMFGKTCHMHAAAHDIYVALQGLVDFIGYVKIARP
jgi:hypothetical protein